MFYSRSRAIYTATNLEAISPFDNENSVSKNPQDPAINLSVQAIATKIDLLTPNRSNVEFSQVLESGNSLFVLTREEVRMPQRIAAQIFCHPDRSNEGLIFSPFVVRSEYKGFLKIRVFNPSRNGVSINFGMAIAQLFFLDCI